MALSIFTQTLVVLLAYWAYQQGRYTYNLLVAPPLPHSYFSGGDANTTCKNVRDDIWDAMKFCEDATLWHAKSATKVIVSCDSNRLEWNTVMGPLKNPNPKGEIWVYEYDKEFERPRRLRLNGFPANSDFHPLGVDVLPATETEPAHLFVVNHGRNFSTVEQFKIEDGRGAPYHAQYVRTWSHKAIHAPNAMIPLSPTSFFLTNDHYLTRRLPDPYGKILPVIETVLALPGGWVDRLDLDGAGEIKVTRAVSNIPFANGIALSPNGREVAVVSTTRGSVQLYDRDVSTNALTYRESVYLPFNADNLSYDEEKGSLVVAGHPSFPTLLQLVAKKRTTSPSWVVEIERREENDTADADAAAPYSVYRRVSKAPNYTIKTLYQSNGDHYTTSATGVQHGKNLFVAGLYGQGILHCTSS